MLIEEILRQVIKTQNSAFFYTPPGYSGDSSYFFKNPVSVITAFNGDEQLTALTKVEREIESGKVGYGLLSYEAGYAFEKSLAPLLNYNGQELIKFCFFDSTAVLKINPENLDFESHDIERCKISALRFTRTKDEFINKILRIKNHIANGDTYQVNYTIKAKFKLTTDPILLFKELIFNQSSQYCAFVNNGDEIIISISPELFFSINGKEITVRPMKGTIKRGINSNEDLKCKNELLNSVKDKAENLMIVDLLRNDIGRVSEYGSIQVNKIFEIEKYESLYQMVSEIKGKLKEGIKFSEIIRSIFPCGSITGAPKIRTMGIIKELEVENRGIYTGAIGLIKDNGMIFNVAIRTLTINKQTLNGELGIGSGIVWDSDPEKEFEETLLKSKFLTKPNEYFELIETMLVEKRNIFLLDRHMERLKYSAEYFLFHLDGNEILNTIKRAVESLDISKKYVLRLLLNKWGKIKIEIKEYPVRQKEINIIISGKKINSGNPFQYFKTTLRKLYDDEYHYYSAKGFFDVIFINEREEISEGAITNIFIKQKDIWLTPRISSGILSGIYRNCFIESNNNVKETHLYKNDLLNADEIMLTNSVRGKVKVNKLFGDFDTLLKEYS